jgi:hypothetical protein
LLRFALDRILSFRGGASFSLQRRLQPAFGAALSLGVSPDRNRLQALVDALPDTEVPVAISFVAELADEEIVDTDTAAALDRARVEPGEDLSLEEVRRRLGL